MLGHTQLSAQGLLLVPCSGLIPALRDQGLPRIQIRVGTVITFQPHIIMHFKEDTAADISGLPPAGYRTYRSQLSFHEVSLAPGLLAGASQGKSML